MFEASAAAARSLPPLFHIRDHDDEFHQRPAFGGGGGGGGPANPVSRGGGGIPWNAADAAAARVRTWAAVRDSEVRLTERGGIQQV